LIFPWANSDFVPKNANLILPERRFRDQSRSRQNKQFPARMETNTDEILLDKCRKLIEAKLGWEEGARWSTHDFETLGSRIQETTGVSLSIATLKRIWGKIRYDSKPTPTTLNTLAQYVGYEDWRDFRKGQHLNGNGHAKQFAVPPAPIIRKFGWWIAVPLVVAGIALGAWPLLDNNTGYSPSQFSFSSRKVVDQGVPNSVIFDYDASVASTTDSIFIQQSWDKRLTTRVAADEKQHTSIYYYPGFFEAKLVVNGTTMLEHDLLITTAGWLASIEQPRVPVYLGDAEARIDGALRLTEEIVASNNIPLQPEPPIIGFHYFDKFAAASDDFVFETRVRNDYGKGGGACRLVEVRIQFEGPAVLIPLSAPGCVSELFFSGLDGKKHDLSVFGRNLEEWVNVKCVIKNNKGEVFIDGSPAKKFIIPGTTIGFVGTSLRFQGPGSVDFVRATNSSGMVIFEDDFEQ
jgi:hypothetical protein